MTELNKTLTVQALEDALVCELEEEDHVFVTEAELDDTMRGYDVGVESGEALIERLCGEHGWAYEEREGGFKVAEERWKLAADDRPTREDMW